MESENPQANHEWDIIQRSQQGDSQAFRELVSLFHPRVVSLLFRLVHRREVVEDLSQEVFLKVFRSLGSYDRRSRFGTWVGRITINHAYDYLRRQRTRHHPETWPSLEEVGGLGATSAGEALGSRSKPSLEREVMLKDLVARLLERASAKERILLTLKELEGYSIQEIGKLLNRKPATVKVQLLRARRRMVEDYLRLLKQERK
jgi:RNA polymerase sigma-70 factor (ECF subfamily)